METKVGLKSYWIFGPYDQHVFDSKDEIVSARSYRRLNQVFGHLDSEAFEKSNEAFIVAMIPNIVTTISNMLVNEKNSCNLGAFIEQKIVFRISFIG